MGCTKRIVNAFTALGKTGKAACLAQCQHFVAAACENFMGVSLMAHIPDNLIGRRIKDVVQGNCELNDTKTRTQVTARNRHRVDDLRTQFISKLTQLWG